MPDPVLQIKSLYLAGFDIDSIELFTSAVAVTKGNCIALYESTEAGFKPVGQAGWRMGKILGVLLEKDGRKVFQAKDKIIEATPERLAELASFRSELERLLGLKKA